MPRYKYRALDVNGKTITSYVSGSSKTEVKQTLESSGLFVTHLRSANIERHVSKPISHKEFLAYTAELIALLRAGIPLVESLSICQEHSKNERFSETIKNICKEISSGGSYSESCKKYPELFDDVYTASIRTAEQTGDLVSGLGTYRRFLDKKIKIYSDVKSATIYPAFLLAALFVVMAVLFVFVVPRFSELYESFGAELPFITSIVVMLSNCAPYLLVGLILLFLSATIFWKSVNKSDALYIAMDKILKKTPIVGPLVNLMQQARFLIMLKGLLNSGSTLVQSLKIIADSLRRSEQGLAISSIISDLEQGNGFASSMEKTKLLPFQLVRILATGEKSGALVEMLDEAGRYTEEKLDEYLKNISKLIEPVLMFLMGGVLGFVIIAMYLPIFYLAEVVQ